MTYITRDDGERFVIPSYRDVLTVKQKSAIKPEIVSLSKSYGEYITLQRKAPTQYEVAFSTDRGYLLGESVWDYFQRPVDMVYCEAVTGTSEAILVIVKSGSVYLDGRFPVESIPEELVVFLTEQNNFEIFIYGDVPIGKTPEDGKFSFDTASVKSFKVLDAPVFPTLPLQKSYQFDLVDSVLKSHGIGVFPIKPLIGVIVGISVLWMAWSYFSTPAVVEEPPPPPPPQVNPYQGFLDNLSTPTPDSLMNIFLIELKKLYGLPGWTAKSITFANGNLTAQIISEGSLLKNLYEWAKLNDANVAIRRDGMIINLSMPTENRSIPTNIYPARKVLAQLIDKLSLVYPGNHIQLGDFTERGPYTEITATIAFENISPELLQIIGQQLRDYPIMLRGISVTLNNGSLSGAINLLILGN